MSISNYLELKILDKIFNGVDFTTAPVYVSLHTADPGEAGASEVTGGSYARQQAPASDWNAAASGAIDNSAAIQFADMPAATVTHVGIFDALSGGNFLWGGALTASVAVTAGQTFRIAAGNLDVTLD